MNREAGGQAGLPTSHTRHDQAQSPARGTSIHRGSPRPGRAFSGRSGGPTACWEPAPCSACGPHLLAAWVPGDRCQLGGQQVPPSLEACFGCEDLGGSELLSPWQPVPCCLWVNPSLRELWASETRCMEPQAPRMLLLKVVMPSSAQRLSGRTPSPGPRWSLSSGAVLPLGAASATCFSRGPAAWLTSPELSRCGFVQSGSRL